jgi:hypothetical protein
MTCAFIHGIHVTSSRCYVKNGKKTTTLEVTILTVAVYGREIRPVSFWKERSLRMFVLRVRRRVFELKVEGET